MQRPLCYPLLQPEEHHLHPARIPGELSSPFPAATAVITACRLRQLVGEAEQATGCGSQRLLLLLLLVMTLLLLLLLLLAGV